MFLTREMILAADDLHREQVSVPEWGGDLYVRMLTGAEREVYDQALMQHHQAGASGLPPQYKLRLVAMTVCDAAGQALFTLADVEAMGGKSWMPLEKLYEVATRINRLGAEAVEMLAGESTASLNGASGTV